MEIGELLIEGKTKRLYTTDDPETAVVYFKDEARAFHGLKRGRILGKGEVNNAICRHLYEMLEKQGVENHFIRQLDARQSLVKRVEMIPIGVKVRNIVAGSLAERMQLPVGTRLKSPVVEFVLKSAPDSLVNITHIAALELADENEMDFITETALKINAILSSYLAEIGIELIDFRLEFGRYHNRILLADEISPDVARFWDARTREPLDMDRFRRDLGDVAQAYQEVLRRMMGE